MSLVIGLCSVVVSTFVSKVISCARSKGMAMGGVFKVAACV